MLRIQVTDDKYIEEKEKYILAKGGDGTLLHAINKFRYLNKPFFGEASGTVNFLMNKENRPTADYIKKTFHLIMVTIKYRKDGVDKSIQCQAFNDVMIGGNMNSWIEFEMEDQDELFGKFMGGGMIFSTPQGSTGINKNNHGVILPLDSNLWSITGDKTERKIEYVVAPRNITLKVKSRTPVTVWVDGINHVIDNVQSIFVKSGDTVEVIFNDFKSFQRKRRI
jgi:NAD kinase